jgi:phosphohistidine phosphatase
MPELLLARHAKSDYPPGVDDHARPLAQRGRRDAHALGVWLSAKAGPLDRIVISTSTRTRQTWEIASSHLEAGLPCEFTDNIYEADWRELLTVARESGPSQRTLLIGHNPGMEDLATILATNSLPAMHEKFPTSAVARLTFEGSWEQLDQHGAELVEFVVPRG